MIKGIITTNYSKFPNWAIAYIMYFLKTLQSQEETIASRSVLSWKQTQTSFSCWDHRSLTLLMFSLKLFGEHDKSNLLLTNLLGVCLKCIRLAVVPFEWMCGSCQVDLLFCSRLSVIPSIFLDGSRRENPPFCLLSFLLLDFKKNGFKIQWSQPREGKRQLFKAKLGSPEVLDSSELFFN